MVSLMRKPAWSEPKAIRGLRLVSGMLASCGDFNGLCNEPQSNASALPREALLRTSPFLAGSVFNHAAWRSELQPYEKALHVLPPTSNGAIGTQCCAFGPVGLILVRLSRSCKFTLLRLTYGKHPRRQLLKHWKNPPRQTNPGERRR